MQEARRRELHGVAASHDSLVAKLAEASSALGDATAMAEVLSSRKGESRALAESRLREAGRSIVNAIRQLEQLKAAVEEDARKKLEGHEALDNKLSETIALLAAASTMAEALDVAARTRFAAESGVQRRLRLRDVVRTVNAARQHVSRVQAMSVTLSRALKEHIEEAAGDLWSAFE